VKNDRPLLIFGSLGIRLCLPYRMYYLGLEIKKRGPRPASRRSLVWPTNASPKRPRLASGLARLGVEPGDTVAIMDWDSCRYLECFFAVP
jgi:hypothetical protein